MLDLKDIKEIDFESYDPPNQLSHPIIRNPKIQRHLPKILFKYYIFKNWVNIKVFTVTIERTDYLAFCLNFFL